MKKFIAIYHAAPEAMAQMTEATPEQQAEGMKYWMTWKDQIGESLVDMGSPLFGGVSLAPSGVKTDSTGNISGFSIVKAENAAAAQALFHKHPHLQWHPSASIEVYQFAEM